MITLHSGAQIVRQLLYDNGYAEAPAVGAEWPCFVSSLPDGKEPSSAVPDNALCAYDTAGLQDGRYMTGTAVEHGGIQIKVRASDYPTAQVKAKQIAAFLDSTKRETVTLDATDYRIDNVSRSSTVTHLGNSPDSKRRTFFTINALVTITEV